MVYIKSLEKNILPYYLAPYKNELFSSWFCRLSIHHNLKPQSFVLNYLGKGFPFWNRDIDLYPSKKLIDFFQNHTPLNKKNVKEMFLDNYASFAFESKNPKGYNENILSLGILHRKRKLPGLLCCPSCLKNKSYYKKEWRLITSIICVECNEYLIDKCQSCNFPITFHRLYIATNSSVMDYKSMDLCSNCNTSLSTQQQNIKPTKLEIQYQKYINKSIQQGFNQHSMYSFTYIRVLLHLSQQLCSSKNNNRFRKAIITHFTQNYISLNDKSIQRWNIIERRSVLPFIFYLLNDLNTLSTVLIDSNVMISYLDPEKRLPFWFKKLISH